MVIFKDRPGDDGDDDSDEDEDGDCDDDGDGDGDGDGGGDGGDLQSQTRFGWELGRNVLLKQLILLFGFRRPIGPLLQNNGP